MSSFLEDYVRGLGMSVRNNALAYGYSITSTASFGVLSEGAGPVSVGRIFLFVAGAGLAFAVVNAVVTRGFQRSVESEPAVVLSLGTAMSVFSISVGVGVATLLAELVGGWISWLLGALLATWAYLAVAALEIALAKTLHIKVGDDGPEERSARS